MRWTEPDGRPRRHARVWLEPASWRRALREPLAPDRVAALDAWIAAGRAVVGRRRDGDMGGACAVAVALPLAAGRPRIGFAIDARAIVRIAPPLTLGEAIVAAPAAWHPSLVDLHDRAARIGAAFHVYGSLAWQAISGEACVWADSDVDLLWPATTVADVDRVLTLLEQFDAEGSVRLDGEVLLPNGDAVAWRECLRSADRVLVKHQDRVSLQPWPACWRAQITA